MLDWLIVGGGIHGTYLSHYLTKVNGVARHRLRVVDPHAEPLSCWNHHTRNTGMMFMRSTSVHHIDVDPTSLRRFAETYKGAPYASYCEPYFRPGYNLFQKHTAEVIARNRLADLRLQARATSLTQHDGNWIVETDNGPLLTQNVVLAIGRTALQYPDWCLPLKMQRAPIHHLFATGFELDTVPAAHHVVVVGGGITAGQVALTLLDHGQRAVTLISRHPLKQKHFDSEPGWMGPKYLSGFKRKDIPQRRQAIQQARHRGTMAQEIYDAVHMAIDEEGLAFVQSSIELADVEGGQVHLQTCEGRAIVADTVILATGFCQKRPGGLWLDQSIQKQNLPLAGCGYPVVDETLQWAPSLFVSGPLAELEVGPVAANIIGARMAARKITDRVAV